VTTDAQEPGRGLAAAPADDADGAGQPSLAPAPLAHRLALPVYGGFLLLVLIPFALSIIDGLVLCALHGAASIGLIATAVLQRRMGLAAFGLAVLAIALLWSLDVLSDNYMANLLVTASLLSIAVSSLNMSVGCTGLMSLSHAGFMGVGAYAFAILTTQSSNPPPGAEIFNLPYAPALIVAGLMASLVALIVSPILRLRGHFFVLATVTVMLSLSQVVLA